MALAEKVADPMRQLINFIGQNVVLAIFSLLIGVMLARGLGPVGRGELALFQTCALFVTNILPWGTHVSLSRLIAKNSDQGRFLYAVAYKIALVVGIVGLIIYSFSAFLLNNITSIDISSTVIIISSIIIPFSIVNAFQVQMELGRGNQLNFGIIRLSVVFMQFFVIIYWYFFGKLDVLNVLLLFALSSLTSGIIGFFLIKRTLETSERVLEINMGFLFQTSQKFGVTILVSSLLLHIDKVSVAFLFPTYDVGLYVVAAALAQTIHIIGEGFSQLMFARVAQHADIGVDQWASIAKRIRLTVVCYFWICILMICTLPFVLPIIFGYEYQGAAALLLVLVPAAAFQSLCRSFEEMIKALDGSFKLLLVSIVPIFLILLFSIFGAHYGSLWTLACGVLIAQLICLVIYLYIVSHLSGLSSKIFLIATIDDFKYLMPKKTNNI